MLIERSYQRLLFPEKEMNKIRNTVYDIKMAEVKMKLYLMSDNY